MAWRNVQDQSFIGLPITERSKVNRVSHITPAQNERLRRAMIAYKDDHCDGSVTELAERLARAQPSVSDILNRRGGASYETAKRFARLVRQRVEDLLGPPEPAPGEDLSLPPTLDQPRAPDPLIGTLLLKIAELPGLKKWLDHNPGAATVSEVCRAIEAFEATPGLARASDGQPIHGWDGFFADMRAERLTAPEEPQKDAAKTLSGIERRQTRGMPKTSVPAPESSRPRAIRRRRKEG